MLKLTHRLTYFPGLTNPDPRHWGFTAFQAAVDPHTPGNTEAVIAWIEAQKNDLEILLAFTPGPDNALFAGAALPESWYGAIIDSFEELQWRYKSRIVGIRWNHEYRSSIFAPSAEWEAWLDKRNNALLQYVVRYQRKKWNQLLADTQVAVHPVSFLEQSSGSDWDRPSNADFRTTFRLWCQYQCERQAIVINRIAGIAATRGLPFYLYPGGRSALSPRLLPELEYSLDQSQIKRSVILEAGGWHDRPTAWVDEVAHSIRHRFIWTNQIGAVVMAADPAREFGDRLNSRNAVGSMPQGVGFWCNWTADFVRQTPQCQVYMDQLKEVLR